MSAPQGGYSPQAYPNQGQYPQQPFEQPGFQEPSSPTQPTAQGPAPAHGGKKKRAYAGQAYEFGAGANAALGGQLQGGGDYGGQPYAGYPPQTQGYQQPAYGADQTQPAPAAAPGYGQPEIASVGGYQPPAPVYPTHGATASVGGMGGVTQQFNQMAVGEKQQQPPQAQQRVQLNQLYPTDLVNQPFNVAELEFPPPPITLPPNVSLLST